MATDTKTALLDAAERQARARGVDGFSYADLSHAVGIRKASIHYHFATKSDLCAALMDRYHRRLAEACDGIAAQHGSGATQLLALVDLYRAATQGGQALCLCVALTASRDSLTDEVRASLAAFRAMMVDRIAAMFVPAQADGSVAGVADPGAEASATLALLEGAHLAARATEDVGAFDRAVEVFRARCRVEC